MDPFSPKSASLAAVVCTLMATRALRKRTLTVQGAVAGFVMGFVLVSCGLRGLVLFGFYQLGSWATKYKIHVKMTHDASLQTHSQRGASQVLCVSVLATGMTLWHAVQFGAERPLNLYLYPDATRIACGVVAHHASCLADTLASEMGMLLCNSNKCNSTPLPKNAPFLVTQPWRRVPPGTNGGVSVAGLLWSIVGGLIIGTLTLTMDYFSGLNPQDYAMSLLFYSASTGLLGSLLDSIIGATLQATYYDPNTKLVHHAENRPTTAVHLCGCNLLTNEQVNLVSTALVTYFGGWVLTPLIFR